MILTPHILAGAAVGAKTKNLGLIVILSILSHFILDKIIHTDYSVHGIVNFYQTGDYRAFLIDALKITVDALIGLLIVLWMAKKTGKLNSEYLIFIALGIFFAVLPDILIGLNVVFRIDSLLTRYVDFQKEYLHYKKMPGSGFSPLGILTQVITTGLLIFVFLSRPLKLRQKQR